MICEQVLEHVVDPWRAAANLRGLCAPGGHVIVSTPFLIKVHELPPTGCSTTGASRRGACGRCSSEPASRSTRSGRGETASAWSGNFDRWSAYRRWHSLRNEPDFPVQVWAFARCGAARLMGPARNTRPATATPYLHDRLRQRRNGPGRLRAVRRGRDQPAARARTRDRGDRVRQRRLDLPQLQPDASTRSRTATTSRRWSWSTRTPRSSIPTSSPKMQRGARRPRGRAGRLRRRGRGPQHRLVGGLGHLGLVHAPLRGARRRRDPGALLDARRRSRPTRRLGEVDSIDGFVIALSPWAMREPALRRVAGASSTATTSTSACRPGRPARRSSPPTSGSSTTTRCELIERRRGLDRRPHEVAEKWDGQLPDDGSRDGDWKRRARRAEAEAAAARLMGRRSRSCSRVAQLEASSTRSQNSLSWRLTAPLRWLERRSRGAAGAAASRSGPSAERLADLLARERRLAALAERARAARRARRRASRQALRRTLLPRALGASASQLASSASSGSARPGARPGSPRGARARVAVPGRERPPRPRPPRARPRCQRTPKPKKAGTTGKPQLVALGDEVLDRGQDPVARPALARGDAGERQPAGRRCPGSPGARPTLRPSGWRCSLGDPLGRVVGVAARERPADVVEDQQRQRRAPGARSAISRSSSLSVK